MDQWGEGRARNPSIFTLIYTVKIWQDASYYDGEWKHDYMHGRGKMVHADGDSYEGDWLNDMANGTGVYVHSGVLIIFVFYYV
jgi:hypothetical protein